MSLTYQQVVDRINGMHLDELDIEITRDGVGFAIGPSNEGSCVADIGSSYEVPDHIGEHGIDSFTAGPWTAYQYHPSYVTPRYGNFADHLDDLAAGRVNKVILGVTGVEDNWVFGIQAKTG
ncbi:MULTISPECIES: hypothetical protein [Mycolicibacter]|uniref:Uncharacterized protein n=2 Tax=Mycolicibacter TaxID=1073531 RepID=A0ABU5XLJ7_9MYCO|nr:MULTISPECIES: hypothetical protein [unclassified Mycolicibacter]MEB3023053.1 hypothetical protein [Mycolicibacter sp. MYC098]MEB3033563.1 hypothetical protein [Mycolicibacter sp. MYC340]